MANGEQGSEQATVEMPAADTAATPSETRESTNMRSEDGRARLEMGPEGAEAGRELRQFQTQRSADGMRSAHEVMDRAQAAGATAPAELGKSFAAHPERVDLLRDEPASLGFWRERAQTDAQGDGGADTTDDASHADEARAVAEGMADDAEARLEVPKFEPPENWIGDINAPGRDWPGREENCVFCGLATENRWRGQDYRAAEWPHGTGVDYEVADELIGPLHDTSAPEIRQALLDAGPGSSGIVGIAQGHAEGHVLNVVNDRGQVRWLDGQVGTIDTEPPGTATGFVWRGRDREGGPL